MKCQFWNLNSVGDIEFSRNELLVVSQIHPVATLSDPKRTPAKEQTGDPPLSESDARRTNHQFLCPLCTNHCDPREPTQYQWPVADAFEKWQELVNFKSEMSPKMQQRQVPCPKLSPIYRLGRQ